MFAKSTQYAIRAIVYLAKNSSVEKKYGIKKIADDLGFPEAYLAKVLQYLVKRKVIESTKGPHGGFFVNDKIMNVSLLEIIDMNEGLYFFDKCGLGLIECDSDKPCPIHVQYEPVKTNFRRILDEKKISDVLNDLDNGLAFLDLD